jgi:hypothetical protein
MTQRSRFPSFGTPSVGAATARLGKILESFADELRLDVAGRRHRTPASSSWPVRLRN